MRGQEVFVKASMLAGEPIAAIIAERFGRVVGFGFVPSNRNVVMRFARFIAAEFDRNRPVTLEGTVKEMRWVNPHSWLHVYVEDEGGEMVEWAVEGGAPSALLRRGWTRDSLPPGTRVIVEGYQAKDGSLRANARDISFPDGTSLSLGQSNIGAPYEETEGQ